MLFIDNKISVFCISANRILNIAVYYKIKYKKI